MKTGIDALKEGAPNIAALARELSITRGAIHQWRQVPAERVIEVEKVTGIKREILRPDLYNGMGKSKRKGKRK